MEAKQSAGMLDISLYMIKTQPFGVFEWVSGSEWQKRSYE